MKVDPGSPRGPEKFSGDVQNIWHFGTGDFQITVAGREDLERAKPLIEKSYEAS